MASNYIDLPALGSGTVTSVALTVPSILLVAGSPITTSGTLAVTLATQTANTVFAGPSSAGPSVPTFRALVAADIPTVLALAAVGSSPNANGASVSGNTLTLQPADGTNPGVLSTTTQSVAGAKTFTGNTLIANNAASVATIGGASSTAVHVLRGGLTETTRSISGNLTIDTTTTDNNIFADTSGGAISLTLPVPVAGRTFRLVDTTNSFSTNNLTIVRNGSEKINNVTASKVLAGGGLIWTILTDGTNWFVG